MPLVFYDMSGNIWEWTGDFYQKSGRDNPRGPGEGTDRVLRGGCWLDRARDCHSTIRFNFNPGNSFKSIGFRLVRQLKASH